MNQPCQLERISNVDQLTFMKDYVEAERPVIITDAIEHWPKVEHWSLENIRKDTGNHEIPVRKYQNSSQKCLEFTNVKMGLHNFLDIIESDSLERQQYYISAELVEEILPHLYRDIQPPSFVPQTPNTLRVNHPTVWIGRDVYTQIHYHPGTEVLSSCMSGQKRFTLYAPEDSARMYPYSVFNKRFNWSRVNPHEYEENKKWFPNFRDATPIEATLHAGDTLYIPPFWWHGVDTPESSVLVTAFWKSNTVRPCWTREGFGSRFWPLVRKTKSLVLRRSHTHA